jgi:uncharacterized membrane protein
MIALSAFIWLPIPFIAVIGLTIVVGHNLLTSFTFPSESVWYIPWAILHERSVIMLTDSLSARTSYPVLPWIGLMALGYVTGRLFLPTVDPVVRRRILLIAALVLLVLFLPLRFFNLYGETLDWQVMDSGLRSLMSFLNLIKYPPSLLFLLVSMGMAALIGYWLERWQLSPPRWMMALCVFGRAPLFFYIVHLYMLHGLYRLAMALHGPNQGKRFGFDSVGMIWIAAVVLAPLLFALCYWFLAYKKRHPTHRWLAYF